MNLLTCFHADDRVLNIFRFLVRSIPLLAQPSSKPKAADLCIMRLPSLWLLAVLSQQEALAEAQREEGK